MGLTIRSQREHKGLSRFTMAGMIGVTPAQIQKYENGETDVPASRVPPICEALGFAPNELFNWERAAPEAPEAPHINKALTDLRRLPAPIGRAVAAGLRVFRRAINRTEN